MKKLNYIILVLICLCSACNKADIRSMSTLKINLLEGDFGLEEVNNLGFYMGASDLDQSSLIYENIKFDKVDGLFSSVNALEYDNDKKYDVSIYAPYSDDMKVEDGNYLFNLTTDQSSIESLMLNDFLHSGEEGILLRNKIQLESLTHLMSQLEVNLAIGTAYPELNEKNTNVILKDFMTKASINIYDATLGDLGEANDIQTYKAGVKYEPTKVSGFKAIVLPLTLKSGSIVCELQLGDEKVMVSLDKDIRLHPRKKHILNIELSTNIEISCEVVDWDETFTTIDTEILPSGINEVYDVQGNRYDVVKIGNYYWTASNLITTCYNDGTQIVIGEENSEWHKYEEARYCYNNNDSNDVLQRGVFYNGMVAISGKICPSGWEVPTRDQWIDLREAAGGEYAAGSYLKTIEGWLDRDGVRKDSYQGINYFNYNAQPSGFRGFNGIFNHYAEGYGPQSIFKCWTSTQRDELRMYAFEILYVAPNLREDDSALTTDGYPIRCVRKVNQ